MSKLSRDFSYAKNAVEGKNLVRAMHLHDGFIVKENLERNDDANNL